MKEITLIEKRDKLNKNKDLFSELSFYPTYYCESYLLDVIQQIKETIIYYNSLGINDIDISKINNKNKEEYFK